MGEEKNNKTAIDRTIDKSEDDFENKLTYISAGALGLSFAFIEKIVNIENSTNKRLLICGWISLCITLFLNLVSHLISKKIACRIQDDLADLDKKNDKKVRVFNYFSVGFLMIGIVLIIIYASFNIIKDNEIKASKDNLNLIIDSTNVNIKSKDISKQ